MAKEAQSGKGISLYEHKEMLKLPLKPTTVTFLMKGDEVLLGMKMRGLGEGNLVGIGGKVDEKDRTDLDQSKIDVIKASAIREIEEEVGVTINVADLQSRGSMKYYFPDKNGEWDIESHVFVAENWEGEPTEIADESGAVEIEPRWIKISEIPYEKMWDDAQYWLPQVLDGKSIEGEFMFGQDFKVIEQDVAEK